MNPACMGKPRDPQYALQCLRKELEATHFVWISGETYRSLLKWKGATERDLHAIESGSVHEELPTDPEPSMFFRQVAFHRMVLDSEGNLAPFSANMPAVTQTNPDKHVSDTGTEVKFEHSAVCQWPLPPVRYQQSTVSVAMVSSFGL